MKKNWWKLVLGLFSAGCSVLDVIMLIEGRGNFYITLFLLVLCSYCAGYWFNELMLPKKENENCSLEEKLTYYQICNLAYCGLYYRIPKGYNIIWVGPTPGKVEDDVIDGDCVTFERNSFVKPDKIKFSGEYIPVVPEPHLNDVGEYEDDVCEYGDIYIKTEFFISKFLFLYKTENQKQLSGCLDTIFGKTPCFKSEFTFDCSIDIDNVRCHVKNVFMKNFDYSHSEGEISEDSYIEAELVCDYWERELIENKQND